MAIARALVTGTAVILADEPTANLDSTTGKEVIEIMRRLNREQGATFIFATHDPLVIETVVVCALTINLKRQKAPGNVLLEAGEANLMKPSVVNVSQIFTVDKSNLADKIGTLSVKRTRQVLDGVKLILEPREIR
ncbi:MAG: type II toxin-antitoxin system PemK/MazF family toxin [Bacillota bacterium]